AATTASSADRNSEQTPGTLAPNQSRWWIGSHPQSRVVFRHGTYELRTHGLGESQRMNCHRNRVIRFDATMSIDICVFNVVPSTRRRSLCVRLGLKRSADVGCFERARVRCPIDMKSKSPNKFRVV